ISKSILCGTQLCPSGNQLCPSVNQLPIQLVIGCIMRMSLCGPRRDTTSGRRRSLGIRPKDMDLSNMPTNHPYVPSVFWLVQ
ncbi:hypothetical protein LINPERHAP1_LOCUS41963, partial [Linum perenne]